MAIEKIISIIADTRQAVKAAQDINKLNESVKNVDKSGKELTGNLEKSTKGTTKAFKTLKTGVMAVGTALKALGIGLIVSAVAALTDAFASNQKVVDFFNTALTAIGIVARDFVNFVFNNFGKVTEFFTDVFQNPSKWIEKLGDEIKRNLIERFVSLLEVAGFVSDAFIKLFQGDFQGALDSIKEAGVEAFDVLTGVDNALELTGEALSKAGNAIANYATEVVNTAEATTKLRNDALLAAAEQGRLVEKYDRLAEQQRQIRDEERNTIDERIAANNRLGEILEQQQEAMLAQANMQVAAAQREVDLNDTIENRVALTEALANAEGVLAQVEGFRSEQLVNDLALERERLELIKSKQDAEAELSIAEKKFNAERITDELEKLRVLKEINAEESSTELSRLQANIDQYKEGTQARVDAEIEFLSRKQELAQEEILISDKIAAAEEANRQKSLEEQKIVEQTKRQIVGETFGQIADILGENSKAGKIAASAQALINTYQGVTEVLSNKTTLPEPFGTINKIASIATILATGLKAVKDINSVQTLGGGGGGATPSGGGIQAPSFNVVGTSGVNQIAQTLGQEQQPIQAFVVGSNVTTQQELDRNIVETATIG